MFKVNDDASVYAASCDQPASAKRERKFRASRERTKGNKASRVIAANMHKEHAHKHHTGEVVRFSLVRV